MTFSTVVFDAYGTLFDVDAAARKAAAGPDFPGLAEIWPKLSADWRSKQLQYTWLRTIMGRHADFWQVTQDALDWAMEAAGLADPALRIRLLELYRRLEPYPEVPGMLSALRQRGFRTAILSNGSAGMLAEAVASAGLDGKFDAVLSVDEVGTFKPAGTVYDLVEQAMGKRPQEVLFVSSNGWDVAGAAAFGFQTLWVNRAGAPVDRLPGRPERIAGDLSALADLAERAAGDAMREDAPVRYFTAADGLRLAYRDEGRGTPLLCLPGLTRNMSDFDFVARDFSDQARIIRMDLRGRGASGVDADYRNYNLVQESRDVLALLDHLGLERVAILGTSRGGLVAMTLATSHPERLNGVCLVDIGPELQTEGLAYIFSYLGVPTTNTSYDEMAEEMARKNARRFPGVPRARWRLQSERNWIAEGGALKMRYDPALRKAVMEQSADGGVPSLWPHFDAFEGMPVALIRGENSDVLSRETAEKMRRRRPDMIFGEIPDRGHVPFLDEPEAQRVIADFLAELDRPEMQVPADRAQGPVAGTHT